MKFNRFKFLAALLTAAALIACLPAPAQSTAPTLGESAGSGTTLTNLAGFPAVGLAAGVSTNINNIVRIQPGKVLQFTTSYAASNTSTDPWYIYWALSVDGTNYATTGANPNFMGFACNGTTGAVGVTNIPAAVLEGAKYIKFTLLTNYTARTIYVSNLTVGYRN